MKIRKLTIKNFRAFSELECDFEPGVNVLVGLNGFGKTSVLDAIAIAYGQFVGGFETGRDRGIQDADIRLQRHLSRSASLQEGSMKSGSLQLAASTMEHQFPVSVYAEIWPGNVDFPEQWARKRNTLKGRTTQVKALKVAAQQLQQAVQDNKDVQLPLFGYYGTGRLWKEKRLTEKKDPAKGNSSRLSGYLDCLDPESSYTAFTQWLRRETIANLEWRMQLIEQLGVEGALNQQPSLQSRWLVAIRKAIDTVLSPSGWANVRYSASVKEIVASHPVQGEVPVSSLSDGVRNMIGMVADIAYRAVRLNPHLAENAVDRTEGVVLIDEVDMHLHPQWQQLVLQSLDEAFPNLQFIVTTHSPQVLTTVQQHQIRVLPDFGSRETVALPPIGETLGKPSNYVLTQTLNVDPRPPLPAVQNFQQYMALINSGLHQSDEALRLRNKLEESLGADHEDLQQADRVIRRRELLR